MMTESPKPDKYSATWISHSSLRDFLNCPRLYYLRNVYKDPIKKRRIALVEPPLALGLAVHDILENLTNFPSEERAHLPLIKMYDEKWQKDFSGEKGGFTSTSQEEEHRARGRAMIERVVNNPGPILNKTIKIKSDFNDLPYYFLSEEDNIILCGKIDWIEYLPETDSIHIIDFKTGKREEREDSLQLPIYLLIAQNTQSREIDKASYWYLDRDEEPKQVELPDAREAYDTVVKHAKRIKLARSLEHFKCPKNGCMHCSKYEQIISGKAKKVNENSYQDIFALV